MGPSRSKNNKETGLRFYGGWGYDKSENFPKAGILGFEIITGAKRRSIQIFLSVFPDVGQKGKKKE